MQKVIKIYKFYRVISACDVVVIKNGTLIFPCNATKLKASTWKFHKKGNVLNYTAWKFLSCAIKEKYTSWKFPGDANKEKWPVWIFPYGEIKNNCINWKVPGLKKNLFAPHGNFCFKNIESCIGVIRYQMFNYLKCRYLINSQAFIL